MEFAFLTARDKEICERRAAAVAAIGEAGALELERRLADLDACDNALEFQMLCGSDLVEVSAHRWRLQLSGDCAMDLVPNHVKPRVMASGATDWAKVTRLRIEGVGGSHD